MYKIKSTVGEVKDLCKAYHKEHKVIVKNRRVKYIHEHINDRNIFGRKKYKSVKDVIRYMKQSDYYEWNTIWLNLGNKGSYWERNVHELYINTENLPEDREIWLQEDMSFLFMYKGE